MLEAHSPWEVIVEAEQWTAQESFLPFLNEHLETPLSVDETVSTDSTQI